jgi:hypothetical protein
MPVRSHVSPTRKLSGRKQLHRPAVQLRSTIASHVVLRLRPAYDGTRNSLIMSCSATGALNWPRSLQLPAGSRPQVKGQGQGEGAAYQEPQRPADIQTKGFEGHAAVYAL